MECNNSKKSIRQELVTTGTTALGDIIEIWKNSSGGTVTKIFTTPFIATYRASDACLELIINYFSKAQIEYIEKNNKAELVITHNDYNTETFTNTTTGNIDLYFKRKENNTLEAKLTLKDKHNIMLELIANKDHTCKLKKIYYNNRLIYNKEQQYQNPQLTP